MSEEKPIEQKILSKKQFLLELKKLIIVKRMTHIEAITTIAEERKIDYSKIKKLLSPQIIEKIQNEAIQINMLKGNVKESQIF